MEGACAVAAGLDSSFLLARRGSHEYLGHYNDRLHQSPPHPPHRRHPHLLQRHEHILDKRLRSRYHGEERGAGVVVVGSNDNDDDVGGGSIYRDGEHTPHHQQQGYHHHHQQQHQHPLHLHDPHHRHHQHQHQHRHQRYLHRYFHQRSMGQCIQIVAFIVVGIIIGFGQITPCTGQSDFTWVYGPWGQCEHRTCGPGGKQYREVWCTRYDGDPVRNESLCDPVFKPPGGRACTKPCTDNVYVGDRGSGGAYGGNDVTYHRPESQEETVSDSRYSGSSVLRDIDWVLSEWSKCQLLPGSGVCGRNSGVQYRNVTCERLKNPMKLNPARCEQIEPMPTTKQTCKLLCKQNCVVGEFSDWTDCDRFCQIPNNKRIRQVIVPPVHLGDHCPKLSDLQVCDNCTRSYTYQFSNWTDCTPVGGPAHANLKSHHLIGYQTRDISCLQNKGVLTSLRHCLDKLPDVLQFKHRPCVMPQDCRLSIWSNLRPHNTSCKESDGRIVYGYMVRTRQVLQLPLGDGYPCPSNLIEYVNFNKENMNSLPPCRNAKWKMSSWNECQSVPGYKSCGTGTQSRQAICVEAGEDLQERPVDETKCPQPKPLVAQTCALTCHWDCSVGHWSSWSLCNAGRCEMTRLRKKRVERPGVQFRTREPLTLPGPRGRPCPHLSETRSCVPEPCYKWNITLERCETTQGACGHGTRRQKAICLDRVGSKVQDHKCFQRDQTIQKTWTDCYVACSNDCVLGDWVDWSSCPNPCIPQTLGRVSRKRERTIIAYHGPGRSNRRCPSRHELVQTELCPVLADCNVYRWEVSAWGSCVLNGLSSGRRSSTSLGGSLGGGYGNGYGLDGSGLGGGHGGFDGVNGCGMGQRVRSVKCYTGTSQLSADSKCEPTLKPKGSEPCQVDCAVDCHVTLWSEWTACGETCVHNKELQVYPPRFRRRYILQHPNDNGLSCPTDLVQEESCIDLPLCETFRWNTSDWSDCILPPRVPLCGAGIRARNISCLHTKKTGTKVAPIHNCVESLGTMPAQTESCFMHCESECQISPWTSWTGCGDNCDGTRFRYRRPLGKSKNDPKCSNQNIYPKDQHEDCLCNDMKPAVVGQWSDCIIQSDVDQGRFASMSLSRHQDRFRRNNQTKQHQSILANWYCGEGKQFKVISCSKKIRDGNGVLRCRSDEYESRNCTIQCPVDCKMTKWTSWSSCDATCGPGLQKRYRNIVHDAAYGGRKCPTIYPVDKDSQARVCHVDCAMKRWESGSWGPCVPAGGVSCGVGNQTRPVSCKSRLADGSRMTMDPSHCQYHDQPEASKGCELPCPGQCVMSEWSPWTQCVPPCNGQRVQTRSRDVLRTSDDPYQCAPQVQERLCERHKNCKVYTWRHYDLASCLVNGGELECGAGHKEKFAVCKDEQGVDVDPSFCEETQGPVTERMEVSCELPCDNDCLLSVWSDWSPCTTTCGLGFTQRRRSILQNSRGNGRECPTKLDQSKPCHPQLCYSWSVSEWTPCMAQFGVCGAGFQERNVSCVDDDGQPVNSSRCPLDPEKLVMQTSRMCQIPCPGACKLSKWSEWNECFISCQDYKQGFKRGIQARSRSVLAYPVGKNDPCDPNLWESRPCTAHECTNFQWATSGWNKNTQKRTVWCERQRDGLRVHGGCDERDRPQNTLHCQRIVCEPPAHCVDLDLCECRDENQVLTRHNDTAFTCTMNGTDAGGDPGGAAAKDADDTPNIWMYGVIAVGTLFVIAVTAALYNMCELFRTGPRPRRKTMTNGQSTSATGTLNSELGMRMDNNRKGTGNGSQCGESNSMRSENYYKQISRTDSPNDTQPMMTPILLNNHRNCNTPPNIPPPPVSYDRSSNNHTPTPCDPLLSSCDPHYQNDIPPGMNIDLEAARASNNMCSSSSSSARYNAAVTGRAECYNYHDDDDEMPPPPPPMISTESAAMAAATPSSMDNTATSSTLTTPATDSTRATGTTSSSSAAPPHPMHNSNGNNNNSHNNNFQPNMHTVDVEE